MDDSIRAMFPDDDNDLGPFLGKLPPEILDVVVKNLSWFKRLTFAMVGKTCREAVERVANSRAVLTKDERMRLRTRVIGPLAVAAMRGDVEALEWLIQQLDAKGVGWRAGSEVYSYLAAKRGQLKSLQKLREKRCRWDVKTCNAAARGGHLKVLRWARHNRCPWDKYTCQAAARGGHLEVLQWARQNGCPWDEKTWRLARSNCRPYLIEHGCPGAHVRGRAPRR